MAEHTPGPWKVDVDDYGCRTIRGGKSGKHQQAQYKRIANTEGVFPEEEDAANARLIAAAPEQHQALKSIVDLIEQRMYTDDFERELNDWLEQEGRPAIRKATGDAP